MEQNIVSFKVAKAIKEAGYPQGQTNIVYVTKDIKKFKEEDLAIRGWVNNNVIDAPYAIEVWLWLWREKGLQIDIEYTTNTCNIYRHALFCKSFELIDPEETIIAAIEFLVNKDILKQV